MCVCEVLCVRVCYCVSLSLTSARLSAHPPYLSTGGSSPTDPLPVEVVLASDSLLDSSLTLPPSSPPPPLDFLGDEGGW